MPAPFPLCRFLRRTGIGVVLLAGLDISAGRSAEPSMADSPILDFRLTMFDAASGLKTSHLRGGTAIYHNADLLELRDFTLTLLRRDGAQSLQIHSPKALLRLKARLANGDDSIAVQGPNYALTGKRWTCDEPAKTVTVRDQAKVVFNVPLIDVLK